MEETKGNRKVKALWGGLGSLLVTVLAPGVAGLVAGKETAATVGAVATIAAGAVPVMVGAFMAGNAAEHNATAKIEMAKDGGMTITASQPAPKPAPTPGITPLPGAPK